MVFNATFNNIEAGSFIGRGIRSARRKPPTCRESLANFITYCCIGPKQDSHNCLRAIKHGGDLSYNNYIM